MVRAQPVPVCSRKMLPSSPEVCFLFVPMSPLAPPLPTALPDRLAQIIEGLRAAVAGRGPKAGAAAPLIVLVWTRLRRLSERFVALAAAVQAGRLSASHAARPRADPVAPSPPRALALSPPARLPGGVGWLLRLVPEAVGARSQLEFWLADPELASLLKEAPQAGRILRPLCRMLGIPLGPELRLPRRRRRASPTPAVPAITAPAVPDGPPPDMAPASPREPDLRANVPPTAPEWSGLSDAELAREIAAAVADPPRVPKRDPPPPV
jgi:hypothetical protein